MRSKCKDSGDDFFMASMAVAIRQVCALTIQNWWEKCYKRLKTSGFELWGIPASWKIQSNASSVPSFLLARGNNKFDLYNKNSTKDEQTAISDSADSKRTATTTNSSASDRFDQGCNNRAHTDFGDEEIDDTLKLNDENFESSISLLTTMQNGIVGRFVKLFKRRVQGDQSKKKEKKKSRLRNLFKRRKNKGEVPQTRTPPMIGVPDVNAELPDDPLSLYQPLDEDESIQIESDTCSAVPDKNDVVPKEYTAQWVPQDFDSFSIMAESFASVSGIDEVYNLVTDDLESESSANEWSYDDQESYRPVQLVPSPTYDTYGNEESVPFDEIDM